MKLFRNSVVIYLYCIIAILIVGCGGVKFSEWRFPYMYPVQQGNYITSSQINQLKLGMTKDQVAMLIGHPVNQFMFNQNQWNYMFQQNTNDKLVKSYNVNLNFNESNILLSVESVGQVFAK